MAIEAASIGIAVLGRSGFALVLAPQFRVAFRVDVQIEARSGVGAAYRTTGAGRAVTRVRRALPIERPSAIEER